MEECVFFFCTTSVGNILRSDKYLASYARVEQRNAVRSSCKMGLFLLNLTETAVQGKYYCNVLHCIV